MPDSPQSHTKWQRTKALETARRGVARVLVDLETSAPGTEDHQAALARCADQLLEYLLTTASRHQLEELREEFPTLPDPRQPQLFNYSSRSLSAK